MGAAQSKKWRKERRRKKRMHFGGNPGFEMSRSASVDVIRSLNISAASCHLCQQLRDTTVCKSSLGSSRQLLRHTCWKEPYTEFGSKQDGYESCPSCSVSTYCLDTSNQTLEVDRSTMSLNRNFVGKCSKFGQSTSADFAHLLNILKHRDGYEEQNLLPEVQVRHTHQAENRENANTNFEPISRNNAPPESMSTSAVESMQCLTNEKITESITTQTSTINNIAKTTSTTKFQEQTAQVHKKIISILEDEESKLARWKRQKLMTQQLRTLRKHIQEQEAIGTCENVLPLSTINSAQDIDLNSAKNITFDNIPEAETQENNNVAGIDTQENNSGTDSVEPASVSQRSVRSKFSKMSNYRYLDNHPVLSKLQNEQNNRLECMEKRMKEIRINAMREADRRRFAEIFPAKEDNAKTEKMLQEARETLEKIKAEKKKRQEVQQQKNKNETKSYTVSEQTITNASNEDSSTNDSGDIVPVHIVPNVGHDESSHEEYVMSHQEAHNSQPCSSTRMSCDKANKSHWMKDAWSSVNLGNPLTWLVLPFLMFPVILRLLLSLVIGTGSGNNRHNNTNIRQGNNSSNNNIETRTKKQHN